LLFGFLFIEKSEKDIIRSTVILMVTKKSSILNLLLMIECLNA